MINIYINYEFCIKRKSDNQIIAIRQKWYISHEEIIKLIKKQKHMPCKYNNNKYKSNNFNIKSIDFKEV